MKSRNILIGSLALILLLPSVFAIGIAPLNNLGQIMWDFMQQEYSIYFVTFLLFFTLLYAIFMAALARVTVFSSGGNISKQGKIVAGALSGLATTGIFAFTETQGGVHSVLESLLSPFGIYGGIAIAFVTFAAIYFGLRDAEDSNRWRLALAGAGLAMVGAGMILTKPNIMWIGWMIVFIALLFYFAALATGSLGGPAGGAQGGNNQNQNPNRNQPARPGQLGGINFISYGHEGNAIHANWQPVDGATHYEVRARTLPHRRVHMPQIRWGIRRNTNTPNVRFDAGILPAENYRIEVRAANIDSRGPWVGVNVYPPNNPLTAPQLNDIRENAQGFALTWSAVANATQYSVIFQRRVHGAWSPRYIDGSTNSTSYTVDCSNAMIGIPHRFFVRAENNVVPHSPLSNPRTHTIHHGVVGITYITLPDGSVRVESSRTY